MSHIFYVFSPNVYLLQEFSPSGQYIVSADRDFKIRVSLCSSFNHDGLLIGIQFPLRCKIMFL